MSNAKSVLTRIKNNKLISSEITRLLYLEEKLSEKESEYLFTVAHLLIQEYTEKNEKIKNRELYINYAYAIIAITSFKTKNFNALYDFSVNYGYYPIAKKIIEFSLIEKLNINQAITEIRLDLYIEEGKVLTKEQYDIFKLVREEQAKKISFLAPTSYGKSEIIFKHMINHQEKNFVGIIVPTKSLIYQTFRLAKKEVSDRKIIVHDQNYDKTKDNRILAVVTQERALRLIDSGVTFDVLYIDEAHEIFDFDFGNKLNNRSLLLARVIKIARKLNANLKEIYLSPVINESKNLKIEENNTIEEHKIKRDLKILNINYLEGGTNHKIYDRFLGVFVELEKKFDIQTYIINKSKSKNLHFLYRPKYIETFSVELYDYLPNVNVSDEINILINELKNYVHPEYNMIRLLKKGIIYLHGSVPQLIRNYLINFVKKSTDIKHFVANSVILGGVNLPIDNLFFYSGYANSRDLFNLIGRVNRLNEIFNPQNDNLERIFIPIHFIDHYDYKLPYNGKMINLIGKLRDKLEDTVKNPLMDNAVIDESNQMLANEIILNEQKLEENFLNLDFEDKLLKGGAQQLFNYTNHGKTILEERIASFSMEITNENMLETIKKIFIDNFDYDLDFKPTEIARRLRYDATINYYNYFIKQLNNKRLKDRIDDTVKYWKENPLKSDKVYVGRSFGEVKFNIDSHLELYIELNKYINDDNKLLNFAIIKQQLDEDFISFEITKILSTMLEFELITQDQLDSFLYETTNEVDLRILRSGLTRTLYRKLKEDQMVSNIHFDEYGNPNANNELKEYIKAQSGIVRFELELFFL